MQCNVFIVSGMPSRDVHCVVKELKFR